jgi:hypothetical protein
MTGHSMCVPNVMFSGKKYRSMKREKKNASMPLQDLKNRRKLSGGSGCLGLSLQDPWAA